MKLILTLAGLIALLACYIMRKSRDEDFEAERLFDGEVPIVPNNHR